MSTSKLIAAEILCRPVNFILCLLAVAAAATLFVAGPTLIGGYASDANREMAKLQAEADQLESAADTLQTRIERTQTETDALLADMDKQTRRIMRNLGVNLRIVHKDTNMSSLYTDFVAVEFPENYVELLAESKQIETIVHVVATLQQKMKWNDRTVLLVGTRPVLTESQKNEEKPHMVKPVQPGTVLLGHELGAGKKEGETIQIEGRDFKIAKIMAEYGGLQDVQMVLDLHDAQKLLGKEDKINQIMALNCKCKGDRISVIRKELEGVLKDTKVTEFKTRAEAREKQRDLVAAKRSQQLAVVVEARDQVRANHDRVIANLDRQKANRQRQTTVLTNLVAVTTPAVVLAAAVFVGLMTWLNVRERRTEIGLLRALGKSALDILGLFLGKAALVGLVGGVAGCAAGCVAALIIGAAIDVDLHFFWPNAWLVIATIAGAPLIAAMAGYLPTLSAVTQDPAVVLMDHSRVRLKHRRRRARS